MNRVRTLTDIGMAALLASALALPAAAETAGDVATNLSRPRHTQAAPSKQERMLSLHNSERRRLGLPPLTWSAKLAGEAHGWARELAGEGAMRHADEAQRGGAGENLWMGTAGAWDVESMVGMFLAERQHFREAAFPDISVTGEWKDTGHYSQIVWRDTREVGCAVDSGQGVDVLVCRYFPAGNTFGEKAY